MKSNGLLVATLISLLGFAIATVAVSTMRLDIDAQAQKILRSALQSAPSIAVAAVDATMAARFNPQTTPAPMTTTIPACGSAVEVSTHESPLCTGSVLLTIAAEPATPATGAAATTLANINTGTNPNGIAIEGYQFYTVSATLNNSAGFAIGSRPASFVLRLADDPRGYAALDGWIDREGNVMQALGEGGTRGNCNTGDPTCSTATLTNAGQVIAPDDARIHKLNECQDPNAGQTNTPGDECKPVGDSTATPQPDDAFANQSVRDPNATTGWKQ